MFIFVKKTHLSQKTVGTDTSGFATNQKDTSAPQMTLLFFKGLLSLNLLDFENLSRWQVFITSFPSIDTFVF